MTELERLEAKYIELGEEIQALKVEFEPFWEPSGETYYCINESARITIAYAITNAALLGNYYKTEELAQKALDYQLAEQRLRKAVWNLNEGPAPKFVIEKDNFSICLYEEELEGSCSASTQCNPDWFWLHTVELVERLIESHSNDLVVFLRGI